MNGLRHLGPPLAHEQLPVTMIESGSTYHIAKFTTMSSDNCSGFAVVFA